MEMNSTLSEKKWRFLRVLLMSLLLGMLMLPVEAQNRVTVSGRLTDTGQNPLIGASVIEQGTTNGVTTDVDGRYTISVNADAVLEFSFIGYKTQAVQVMNRTQIDVVMEDDAMMIGEVVAIGYGSQRKEDLSMAVTTVKVDDAARSRASDLGYPPPGPHAGCHDHAVRRPDAEGFVLHPRPRLEGQRPGHRAR